MPTSPLLPMFFTSIWLCNTGRDITDRYRVNNCKNADLLCKAQPYTHVFVLKLRIYKWLGIGLLIIKFDVFFFFFLQSTLKSCYTQIFYHNFRGRTRKNLGGEELNDIGIEVDSGTRVAFCKGLLKDRVR